VTEVSDTEVLHHASRMSEHGWPIVLHASARPAMSLIRVLTIPKFLHAQREERIEFGFILFLAMGFFIRLRNVTIVG
jgi:hypothetical protein